MRKILGSLIAVLALLATCSSCLAQGVQTGSVPDAIRHYEALVSGASKDDGATWWRLAIVYQNSARYRDSEHAYQKALHLLRTQQPAAIADVMDDMGTMYLEEGRFGRAEQLEHAALDLRQARNDQVGIGQSWMHLAMVSLGEHHLVDALMFAELAVDRLVPERKDPAKHASATPEQKMTALTYLSHVLCEQGRFADAIPVLTTAREIAVAAYPSKSLPVAYVNFLLGRAHWKSGDLDSAAELMTEGTHGMQAQLGWGHPTYLKAMKEYATFLKQTHRLPEAAEAERTLAQARKASPESDAAQAQAMTVLPQ